MGDPSGVGPEVTVRALDRLPPLAREGIVLIGDRRFYDRACQVAGVSVEIGREVTLIDVAYPGR